MKLTPVGPATLAGSSGAARASASASASTSVPADVHVGAQTERVQAAHAQLSTLPEIDTARVAEIKEALARGEIAFDPKKLAGLIVRHHGGRS